MATTSKRLYGPAQLTSAASTKYTCPDTAVAVITRMRVSNPTGGALTFTLSIGADAAGTRLYSGVSVPAGGSRDIWGPFSLAAGDIVQAFASANASLVIEINGRETYPDGTVFPLSLGASKRFLQDASGNPYLLNECSSWGAFQALSEADCLDYFTKRKAQGFNAAKVSLISFDQRFPGGPPNWQGNAPFTTTNDFGTASGATAYWSHIDRMLAMCLSLGFEIYAVPCYLGYYGDPNQGWANTINSATNSTAKLASFGTFLGNRYKSQPNLIWCGGGDQVPGTGDGASVDITRYLACWNALIAADPNHLRTAHYAGDYGGANPSNPNDPAAGGMLSTDLSATNSTITFNGHYGYNPGVQVYTRIEAGYAISPALPVAALDESYGAFGDPQPQDTDVEIREKAYKAMCSGACGSAYCAGSNWYLWVDWTTDTTSQDQAVIWWNFWKVVPWSSMAPDLTNTYVTSGSRGTHGSANYITVLASTTDLVAYIVSGSGLAPVVNMNQFTSARTARWWNPRAAGYTAIGSIPNTGTHTFTPPDSNDWVLILGP